MPERSRSRGSWLPRVLGGAASEPPPHATRDGSPEIHSGMGAVLRVESLLRSAVCHASRGDEPGLEEMGALSTLIVARPDAGSAVASAYGMALAGRRVALVASGADEIVERLRAAVDRHVPMVAYVRVRDGWEIDSLVASGAPVAVAGDPEHAADLALVARRVSETALTPVVVVLEAGDVAASFAAFRLPQPRLVAEYAGQPQDTIACPTSAQRILFGESRRRVPRWFDPERPTAHGQSLPGEDRAAAALARDVFFRSAAAPAVLEAVQVYRDLTGREPGALTLDGPSAPRRAIVTRGAAFVLARATAERLRATERASLGVAGVVWQGSLADEALGRALERAEVVTSLDRDAGRRSAWADRLRGVASRSGTRWIRATFDELTGTGMLAACRNLLATDRARDEIHLGVAPPVGRSAFPRRQVLLDRVRREFPQLETIALPVEPRASGASVDGSRTVSLFIGSGQAPLEAARSLSARLTRTLGSHVRGRVRPIERGLWEVRVTCGPRPFADPGQDVAVDVLLVADLAHTIPANPLDRMARGGTVVLATRLDGAALAAALPRPWRDAIAGCDLDLRRVDRPDEGAAQVERLAGAAAAVVSGDGSASQRVVIAPGQAEGPADATARLPLAVRRLGQAGENFDNVARFFSELAEPSAFEPGTRAVPDPYVAAGAVPACASSLRDATAGRETVPRIDPEPCTGCGACWASCPDSAIGPLAIASAALLEVVTGPNGPASSGSAEAATAKLRRATKQLGSKLDLLLGRPDRGALDRSALLEARDWIVEKMESDEEQRVALCAAFDPVLERLDGLTLAVTEPFFRAPQKDKKDAGELLLLAVNPYACQGCGICAAVCPAGAIERVPQTADAVASMGRAWRMWEDLPDTSGATIARVSRRDDVGPLAAILLSRHCALSVTGGGAEPGSGERLAVRLVAAVLEYQMQRRVLGELGELAELAGKLRDAIRATLAESVAVEDLDRLHDAMRDLRPSGTAAGELLQRLDGPGQATKLDVGRVKALVDLTRRIEQLRAERGGGAHGAGSARYGVVLTRGAAPDWAGRFPLNPFCVPVAVDLAADGPEVATGILHALLEERVEAARLSRRARLWLEQPADLTARDAEIEKLTWSDLTPEERATLPPILLLADNAALEPTARAGLLALLDGDLPAKVLLIDECDIARAAVDPALAALAQRRAVVASVSIAHRAHLFGAASAALDHSGPALLHVHAPSPRRHGFPTDATIERARLAVDARVHPLLRYEPTREGVFGSRLDLEGNSSPDRDWLVDSTGAEWTPQRWATGETRYLDSNLPSAARGSTQLTVPGPNGRGPALGGILAAANTARRDVWRTLQELAGVVTPFTAEVRRQAEEQVRAGREQELAALRHEYETRLAAVEAEQEAHQAERLRKRLLELAGFGGGVSR